MIHNNMFVSDVNINLISLVRFIDLSVVFKHLNKKQTNNNEKSTQHMKQTMKTHKK